RRGLEEQAGDALPACHGRAGLRAAGGPGRSADQPVLRNRAQACVFRRGQVDPRVYATGTPGSGDPAPAQLGSRLRLSVSPQARRYGFQTLSRPPEIGLNPQRLGEVLHRFLKTPGVCQRRSQIELSVGILGVEAYRRRELLQGLAYFSLGSQREPEIVVR